MKKQFTKVLAVLLTLFMLTGMMIMPAGATETQQSNTALIPDTSWFRGNAVEDDTTEPQTYELSTPAQLLGFAEIAKTYDFAGDTIKLKADIDLNVGWDATTTIGSDGTVALANAPANVWTAIPVFKGTLDGNGHTISGIYSASDFTVPTSSNRYVGGFINELVNGTVKNLIVKNSLATFSSSTGTNGTLRIRIGGLISRIVDSDLQNIYADIDAWTVFNYEYTMGGLFCSVETEDADNVYVGTIENIVGAGCVGRIVDGKCNVKGSETAKINLGNVFGYTADDGATVTLNRISFTGWCNGKYLRDTTKNAVYTGDIVFVKDGYSTKNFSVESYSLFTNEFTNNYGNTTLDSKSWMMTDAGDTRSETYAQVGFKTIKLENGGGFTGEILLPGAVVDMLNASKFVHDTTSENITISADTGWYGEIVVPGETQPETYYLYTPEQLLGFAEIAQTYDFAGDTIKLMADIDLNAGWDATTAIATDGTVTLANAPANVWTAIPVFKGTLDGNGHTISGIYNAREFTVPKTSQRYVGGFIDQLVDGAVKNLVVKNSLVSFHNDTKEGTKAIRLAGFISRVVDSDVENLFIDIDTWVYFSGNFSLGGLICSIETNAADKKYVNKLQNWVVASTLGRVVNGKYIDQTHQALNPQTNIGEILGAGFDNDAIVLFTNVGFIGSVYCPPKVNGKSEIGLIYAEGGLYSYGTKYGYNSNVVVNNYATYGNCYSDYGEMTMSTAAWDNNRAVMEAMGMTYRGDTYEDAGFVEINIENGAGVTAPIMLPGAVVDMLTANTSNLYLQESLDRSKIRFIGVVNISEEEFENFSKLGFDITMTYNGRTFTNTYTTTTVYTSLIANETSVSASEYGGTYFYAVEITGLDAATAGDVVFNVDGITIHAGETTTNVFGSGEYTYSAN